MGFPCTSARCSVLKPIGCRGGPFSGDLRQFFVQRHERRAGIGQQCVKILFSQVWPKDKRITVEVLCQNEIGIAFWRAVGFTDYCLTVEIYPDLRTTTPKPQIQHPTADAKPRLQIRCDRLHSQVMVEKRGHQVISFFGFRQLWIVPECMGKRLKNDQLRFHSRP